MTEAPEQLFTREELNRLTFHRRLVESGKLTEFPRCHHERVVKHLARARKQPEYQIIVLAPATSGGFSKPSTL